MSVVEKGVLRVKVCEILEGSNNQPHQTLVNPRGSKPFPPEFSDCRELIDRLFVHTHRIINRELIPRHALVDITRPVHARNVRDARERGAVSPEWRSPVKWDRAPAA